MFLEGPPDESDTPSQSSHGDDKDNKKEEANKPPVEMVFDLQVFCFQSFYMKNYVSCSCDLNTT